MESIDVLQLVSVPVLYMEELPSKGLAAPPPAPPDKDPGPGSPRLPQLGVNVNFN